MAEQKTFNAGPEDFAPDRWAIIVTLLSMDVVLAFDDLMGLIVPDREAFAAVLRGVILEMRRESAAGGPFYSPERVSASLALLSLDVRTHVAWWGHHIFERNTQEHAELRAWTLTLRYCRRDPARWEYLALPSRISNDALREFLRSIDTSEYDRRREQVYARPLSDWDLHMYALNGFVDDDDDGVTSAAPGTWVYPTVMAYRGYRFWAWMLKHLTAEEQIVLAGNATRIARTTESLMFLGQLVGPSALEIGL